VYTLGDLKAELRPLLWPAGEAANLVPDHDKQFVQALIEIQRSCECWQIDNYSVVPQCATYYDCGLTVLPAPRGAIKRLSVIGKINLDTGMLDATKPDDWCSEIFYDQIDPCHIHSYFATSRRRGCCCWGILGFGGLRPPIPTDEGLPLGLPTLPMGFHYAQTSTDRPDGRRAHRGVWAIERGKIWVAPWIQSLETVVLMWDGIKRDWWDATTNTWIDTSPVDEDPGDDTLKTAVQEYVRWKDQDKWGRDPEQAAAAKMAYETALAELIHDCWQETRERDCTQSVARMGSTASGALGSFFNDAQTATAECPDGFTGAPTSVTVPAGTVASSISVADANAQAQAQAQTEANKRLVCTPTVPTFSNDAQTFTASCVGEEGAPPPEGAPVTVVVPAGTVTSTVSTDDANAQALALAETQAASQLKCTFWNASQTYTATCPFDPDITLTKTVAAHSFSSAISQADADAQALNAAKTQAEGAIVCPGTQVFFNTAQVGGPVKCTARPLPQDTGPCIVTVTVNIAAHKVSSLISQADANQQAKTAAQNYAATQANAFCLQHQCGNYFLNFP
jgi:hypothetical protein